MQELRLQSTALEEERREEEARGVWGFSGSTEIVTNQENVGGNDDEEAATSRYHFGTGRTDGIKDKKR